MKTDTQFVTSISIENLLQQAGITLHGHTERHGSCPRCGGVDRFHVKRYGDRDWFFCRQCHEQRGDAIEYVKWLHGVDFKRAVVMLSNCAQPIIEPTPHPSSLRSHLPTPSPAQPPDPAWQSATQKEIERAQHTLWQTSTAVEWLNNQRCLTDDIIIQFKLGLVSSGIMAGITIPCFHQGSLWAMRVRLGKQARHGGRYGLRPGSKACMFNADSLQSASRVLIVEGEFDTMLGQQEAPSDMAVITLGSAASDPQRWSHLITQQHVIVCTDNDAEGDSIARKWKACLPQSRRVVPPEGKDISDYQQLTGNLRSWLHSL